jgi:hypothetical protein
MDSLFSSMTLQDDSRTATLSGRNNHLVDESNVVATPTVRLIHFEDFKRVGTMPRYPENKSICITLEDVDRSNAFIVFISHCWLRGWSSAEGWDGRAHPDTADGHKYELCLSGINKAWRQRASGMSDCYVWLDFGCIDQEGDKEGELNILDKIVGCCDCIFTPIHGIAELPNYYDDIYNAYNVSAWNGDNIGYMNRGWCRIEMFYAANIPYDGDECRVSKFNAGLHYHASNNRRAHLLYGSKEHISGLSPIVLHPLQNSYFDRYHPCKGHVTFDSDKAKISRLVDRLRPHMNFIAESYDGEMKDGRRHGKGLLTYDDGSYYEGDWCNDFRQGKGLYRNADGNMYEGDWSHDGRHGKGIFRHASGGIYEGDFYEDRKHGKGKYTYPDGSVYEGDFYDNKSHGKGICRFADGNVYEGDWCNDRMHGKGKCSSANGNVYEGDFCGNKIHGNGICMYFDGARYEGEWCNGNKHGKGIYTYPDGAMYEGDWCDDKKHGKGRFKIFGVFYESSS